MCVFVVKRLGRGSGTVLFLSTWFLMRRSFRVFGIWHTPGMGNTMFPCHTEYVFNTVLIVCKASFLTRWAFISLSFQTDSRRAHEGPRSGGKHS